MDEVGKKMRRVSRAKRKREVDGGCFSFFHVLSCFPSPSVAYSCFFVLLIARIFFSVFWTCFESVLGAFTNFSSLFLRYSSIVRKVYRAI